MTARYDSDFGMTRTDLIKAWRAETDRADENGRRADQLEAENAPLHAALERVRAVHERRESDSGSPYCDLCANHGDINWPCATIAALDTPPTEPVKETT